MVKVDAAKGQKQIISIEQFSSLQDDNEKALKFELSNHDEVHTGAFPVYTAKTKDKVYTAELRGEVAVSVEDAPQESTEEKREKLEKEKLKEKDKDKDKEDDDEPSFTEKFETKTKNVGKALKS